jgi:hypothetical protein
MAQRIPYYDELLAALAEPGCAVCRLLDGSSDRLVDAILFEMVNDVGVREELNAARGYCRRHAALLVRTGSALGSATMMQGVLKMLIRTLDANAIDAAGASRLRALARSVNSGMSHPATRQLAADLSPQTACPLCANEVVVERQLIDTLLAQMTPGGELAAVYAASDGLCLPHFRNTVARGLPGPNLSALLAAQRAIWVRLEAELEEFLRKSDHRFRHEPFGGERDSWRRALSAVSGNLPDHLTRD